MSKKHDEIINKRAIAIFHSLLFALLVYVSFPSMYSLVQHSAKTVVPEPVTEMAPEPARFSAEEVRGMMRTRDVHDVAMPANRPGDDACRDDSKSHGSSGEESEGKKACRD